MTEPNDNVDSSKDDNDFTPIRNLFNEWFCRDTSKKIKAVFKAKAERGERLGGRPPYGYSLDENKKLVVDEEAAAVVRRIYALCLDGKGPSQIARRLTHEQILTPAAYCFTKTGKRTKNLDMEHPYAWPDSSIDTILERREYVGYTVNHKTVKPSYKNKSVKYNPPDKQLVFENTHQPIIDIETFELVQKARGSKRRLTKIGTKDKFAGLVYCADCGRRHQNLRAKSISPNQESYVCGNYRATVQSCTAHFIRTVVLEKLVLEDIQHVSRLAVLHEERFVQLLMKNSLSNEQKEIAAKKKELNKANRRMTELDNLFKRLYEDHVSKSLSDERYAKLSSDYEAENSHLKNRVEVLERELSEQGEKVHNVGKFLDIVRKYTDIQELTPTLLREFIDKIVVHEADKSSGKRQQEIEIHYNFVGTIQE